MTSRIVITTYNHARFLDAIDSVMEQTRPVTSSSSWMTVPT